MVSLGFFLPGSGLASARSFVPLGTTRAEDLQKHKDKDRMESVQMMQVGCRLHACTAAHGSMTAHAFEIHFSYIV